MHQGVGVDSVTGAMIETGGGAICVTDGNRHKAARSARRVPAQPDFRIDKFLEIFQLNIVALPCFQVHNTTGIVGCWLRSPLIDDQITVYAKANTIIRPGLKTIAACLRDV